MLLSSALYHTLNCCQVPIWQGAGQSHLILERETSCNRLKRRNIQASRVPVGWLISQHSVSVAQVHPFSTAFACAGVMGHEFRCNRPMARSIAQKCGGNLRLLGRVVSQCLTHSGLAMRNSAKSLHLKEKMPFRCAAEASAHIDLPHIFALYSSLFLHSFLHSSFHRLKNSRIDDGLPGGHDPQRAWPVSVPWWLDVVVVTSSAGMSSTGLKRDDP